MGDLSCDEICVILSYVGYSTPYERVCTTFLEASECEKQRLTRYMDDIYPKWGNSLYMDVYSNMVALRNRWDLILLMMDHIGVYGLVSMLELMHVFKMDELIEKLLKRWVLPTDSINPVIVYYMWKLDMEGKEAKLRELIKSRSPQSYNRTNRTLIRRLIGYTSPEMREYIRDHILIESIGEENYDLESYLSSTASFGQIDMKMLKPYTHLFEYTTDTYYEHLLHSLNEGFQGTRLARLGRCHILTPQIMAIFTKGDLPHMLDAYSNILLLLKYPHLINRTILDKFVSTCKEGNPSLAVFKFFNIIQ